MILIAVETVEEYKEFVFVGSSNLARTRVQTSYLFPLNPDL